MFKSSRAESEANFHVSGILETSKRSKTGELGANLLSDCVKLTH